VVTTLQALSGAGYPGVPSLYIIDNVLPYIGGEEEKIETETTKILGHFNNSRIELAPMAVSAQCHRVNVADGHMAAVRVKLARKTTLDDVRDSLTSFRSLPQELGLHSAPVAPIVLEAAPSDFIPARKRPPPARRELSVIWDLLLALFGLAFFGFGIVWGVSAQAAPFGGGTTPVFVALPAGLAGVIFFVVAVFRLLQRLGREIEQD